MENDSEKKWFKVEDVFDFMYLGKYRLRGRIDGIYLDRKEKMYWIIEHKTKIRINEEKLSMSLPMDFQNMFYVTACKYFYKIPIAGVLYDVIRKPEHVKKASEDMIKFGERIINDINDRPEHFFKRYEAIYSKSDMTGFEEDLQVYLKTIENIDKPQRNILACDPGDFACEYLTACFNGDLSDYTIDKGEYFPELK